MNMDYAPIYINLELVSSRGEGCRPRIYRTGKGKGKVNPGTGYQGPKGRVEVLLYSFLNLGAIWGWVVKATPRPLYSRERSGTHFVGGWVGPRDGLDGCGKSGPHWDSIPGPSSS